MDQKDAGGPSSRTLRLLYFGPRSRSMSGRWGCSLAPKLVGNLSCCCYQEDADGQRCIRIFPKQKEIEAVPRARASAASREGDHSRDAATLDPKQRATATVVRDWLTRAGGNPARGRPAQRPSLEHGYPFHGGRPSGFYVCLVRRVPPRATTSAALGDDEADSEVVACTMCSGRPWDRPPSCPCLLRAGHAVGTGRWSRRARRTTANGEKEDLQAQVHGDQPVMPSTVLLHGWACSQAVAMIEVAGWTKYGVHRALGKLQGDWSGASTSCS